jgi:hypothetical protein
MRKVIWVLVCLAAPAWATTYYVSASSGNDTSSGTSAETAWKTLARVNTASFAPGDAILLKRGDTWNETLIPPSSGTSGSMISFDAYGSGPAPTISGYKDLAAWTQGSGNVWSTSLTVSSVNWVLFGSMWGQKQTAQANLLHDRDFYFSANTLYVYSNGNPATYYGSVAAMLMAGSQLVYVNGKSWLQFQHLLLNWFEGFGVNVAGASDHLKFANMEADGMVPNGTLPLGFYVNASVAPTDIGFYNVDAHLNYDGFKFDGALAAASLVNCRGYANRDAALVDNTGSHATYSYSHFYANDIGILTSQDVVGATDGGNNIEADTAPAVVNFRRYGARVTFTIDDEGKAAGGADFIDSILLQFTSRNLKLSIAVVTGEQYAQGDIPRIQGWFNAGHDINSHSWSHNYWGYGSGPQVFSLQYAGSGTAATVSISGDVLTTTVTGGPGGENLSFDLSNLAYNSYTALVTAINGHAGYTATLIGLPFGHSTTLAGVPAHDIKAAYTISLDKTRFVPDEMATSKAWLQSNITGLTNAEVYVYPAGNQDSQTQGYAAAAGYKGARGGLSMGLGNKEVYGEGVNLQNVTSLGLGGLHGMSAGQIQAKVAALVFKASAWGVPYGIFCHPEELTAQEVGLILDGVIANGGTVITNTQLIDWIASNANVSGTSYYVSAATGGTDNFRPTGSSPIRNAGTNLGATYQYDIAGLGRPGNGVWDIGASQHPTYSVGGGGGSGHFTWGVAPVVAPPSGNATDGNAYEAVDGSWLGARYDGAAELPRLGYYTAMLATPSPGTVRTVTAGSYSSLSATIATAQCGDTIVIPARNGAAQAVYTGDQLVPTQACDAAHYITIRTDQVVNLPAEGTRVSPAFAGTVSLLGRPSYLQPSGGAAIYMPKLVTNQGGHPVFEFSSSGGYFRLIGLEITADCTQTSTAFYQLVHLGGPNASHNIIDRSWVHGCEMPNAPAIGGAPIQVQAGVTVNGSYLAVIDSYLNDFYTTGRSGPGAYASIDSQAIAGGGGSSPQQVIKIVNDFLESGAECGIFGGRRHGQSQ